MKAVKNLFVFILILTLMVSTHAIYPSAATGEIEETFLRVGLHYTSPAVKTAEISSQGNLAVWDFGDETGFHDLEGTSTVLIEVEDGQLKVEGSDGEEIYFEEDGEQINVADALVRGYSLVSSDYLEYLNSDGADFDSFVEHENKKYRGGMGCHLNANDTFRLINRLSIDEYTYGVINGEMNHTNPLEALKVQAVVARSYALTNLGRHEDSGYDLCDSTHCQVYKGLSEEYPKIIQAVDETDKKALYYMNQPVAGYFFKNSGGYTQNVEDVWNSPLGYLRSVRDVHSPEYKWSATFTLSELESKLRNAGHRVGTLISIAITDRTDSGSVLSLKFTGTEGTTILSKEKIRTLLGQTTIKSNRFEITSGPKATGTPDNASKAFVRGTTVQDISRDSMYILNSSGMKEKLDGGKVYVLSGNSLSMLFQQEEAPAPTETTDSIVFEGSGYGHGVGLPQDSAIAMAKAGLDYTEILNFYYTDIEIK